MTITFPVMTTRLGLVSLVKQFNKKFFKSVSPNLKFGGMNYYFDTLLQKDRIVVACVDKSVKNCSLSYDLGFVIDRRDKVADITIAVNKIVDGEIQGLGTEFPMAELDATISKMQQSSAVPIVSEINKKMESSGCIFSADRNTSLKMLTPAGFVVGLKFSETGTLKVSPTVYISQGFNIKCN